MTFRVGPRVPAAPAAPTGPGTPDAAAAEKKPEAKPKPQTLGELLAEKKQTVDVVKKDNWQARQVARDLLTNKGIDSPTQSQIDETLFRLNEAIADGSWEKFSAPFTPAVVQVQDNINERLGNIFFEKKVFSDDELTVERLKLSPSELQKLNGDFESGRSGMVMAASFIDVSHRSEGDFSKAYGDDAWRGFVRAKTYLDGVPKGQLLEKLDLGMLLKTNELIHAPDKGIKASLLRTVSAIGRGFRWDKGGEVRTGRQFARPAEYTVAEVEAMRSAGVKVRELSADHVSGKVTAMLEYPSPKSMEKLLQGLIDTLKSELKAPDADPVLAAANFQRGFVALHPFGDSNGRTSRVLMNRILAEYDLPPAILSEQDRDLTFEPAAWRTEVAKGMARTKQFLSSRLESADNYLGRMDVRALEKSPDKPVLLDGNPFDLGTDGLLYDPAGHAWMAKGDELVPFSQLEHFVFARRVFSQGKEKATETLKSLTESTRALYDRVAADPKAGEKITVRSDKDVRGADMRYQLKPEREVAELLVSLSKIEQIDPTRLFTVRGGRTEMSATMSKHAQIDLELWYLERGLKSAGHGDLAGQVREQRASLFTAARERLLSLGDATRKSPENPLGFTRRYELMMYEASVLSAATFDEAMKKFGDEKATVWRGDYSFARLIGMAPNNDVRQPDAKAVAKQRAKNDQVTNLFDDLVKLEGSAVGRQYISTTSDLSLLAGSFADSTKGQNVNLGMLPGFVKEHLFAYLKSAKEEAPKEGETPKTPEEKKKEEERGGSLKPLPEGGVTLRDFAGVPGDLLTVKIENEEAGRVRVDAKRKAFRIELDKDALLPGIYALGGPSFEAEQEIHGIERVMPWAIKAAFTAESLREELPVVNKPEEPKPAETPAAETTPATPAAG